MINVDEQVVVVHLLALERIVRGAIDGIRVGSSSACHKVGNAAMLVAFVVVHVPGEHNGAKTSMGLAFFQHLRECLLLGPG